MYVDLDGQRIATLLADERVVREIPPGHHRVTLNNTLVRKHLEFDAGPGEVVHFEFANHAGRFAIGFLAVMGVAPLYLKVRRVDSTE